MSVMRLAIVAWVIVILQVSYSAAKIDPENYHIDKSTGLRKLNINKTTLTSEEKDEVRLITSKGPNADSYCRFSGINLVGTTWLVSSQDPDKWCFDEREQDMCCDGEGSCHCNYQNRYNCDCYYD